MTTISLRLAESLHKRVRELARQEGISINQLVATAVAEKVSALMTADYLEKRAGRGSRKKFDVALSRVRERKPAKYNSK